MKILWVAHRDPANPRAGGAERTIYEVGKRLSILGNEITLLSSGWKNCRNTEVLDNLKILRVGKNIGLHLAVPVLLLRENFDFVISDLGHAIPWLSPVLLYKRNVAFFRHLHSRSLPGQVRPITAKLLTAIEKCYFLLYSRTQFVTESTSSLNDLIELGIKRSRITIIKPGVDMVGFKTSTKTEFPSLVYFGGLRKYKRPEEALSLFYSLIKLFPSIRMHVVGEGPERKIMERTAEELNLTEKIEFHGRLETEELSMIVSKSWLNIHTSITEGWGYSILEASASGTPTVAYDVAGVVDAVENGVNGIKVEDGNRRALAEAAKKILENPEPWWSSSPKVAEKYSWDVTAQKWQRLILEVMQD